MLKNRVARKFLLISGFTITMLSFQNCKQSGDIELYDEQSVAALAAVDAQGNATSEVISEEDSTTVTSNENTSSPPILGSDSEGVETPPTTGETPTTGGTTTTPPPEQPAPQPAPVPSTPEQLIASCEEATLKGKITRIEREVLFENPGKVCDWGVNGNLSMLNSYVRARTEQAKGVELPAGAKVCNVMLRNVLNEKFVYDDNIILTLNNIILASTTNFSQHFTAQKPGLYKYEWSKLINKAAQNAEADTQPSKQFCAGKDLGQSSCLFPITEEAGGVALSFDKVIIQNVLGITSPTSLSFGMITTGDNDHTDCQHVPLTFKVELEYYE